MSDTKLLRIQGARGRQLAELSGIRNDLELVQQLCDRLLELYARPQGEIDWLVFESLAAHVAIRYARCFSTGVRPKLSTIVFDGFSHAQRELHQFVLEFRNKYVAHSVNPYEDNAVVASAPDALSNSGWTPPGVLYIQARSAGIPSTVVQELVFLAGWLREKVLAHMQLVKSDLLEELRRMSPQQVARLPTFEPYVASPPDVIRRRT